MKLNCAVIDDYQGVAASYADWSAVKDEVNVSFHRRYQSEGELVDAIKNCEIVIVMRERTPFEKDLLDQLSNLKLLITSGARNSAIDVEHANKNGVLVCGTLAYKQPPTELAWALILGLARNMHLEVSNLKSGGPWQSSVGVCLSGKTLGLMGLGKIGERMARIGKAFEMNVIAWSQNLTEQRCQEVGVTYIKEKIDLIRHSDFISLHLIPGTRNLNVIAAKEFDEMKNTAFLINTSRSRLVDQDAMLDALVNKKIAGVGIDVFDEEPLPKDSLLRKLDNVLATPHLGYVADLNYNEYFSKAVSNIKKYLAGKKLEHILS